MHKISSYGVAVVLIYLAIIAWLFYTAQNCSGMFCGAVIVVGILPWSALFEDGIPLVDFLNAYISADHMIWYWALVILNILILYFLSAALQRWLRGS